MYDIIGLILGAAIVTLLAYKIRAATVSGTLAIAVILYEVYIGNILLAEIAALVLIPIAIIPEISDIEDFPDVVLVGLIFARFISFIYADPNSSTLAISAILTFLIAGAFKGSLATRSLALLIVVYIMNKFVSYRRITPMKVIALFLMFVGPFIPNYKSEYAYYAGRLERPLRFSVGFKITAEAGAEVWYTTLGYIIDGRFLIETAGLSIIRRGPALVVGITLPVKKPSIFSRRKKLEELVALESTSVGPVKILETDAGDIVRIGPIKIKDRSEPCVIASSRKIVTVGKSVYFESPEGRIEVKRGILVCSTISSELYKDDYIKYRGPLGELEANLKERRIEGFISTYDLSMEFDVEGDGIIIVDGRRIEATRSEAYSLLIKAINVILMHISEEFSEE